MGIATQKKKSVRNLRRKRIRGIVAGNEKKPRLAVFRSAKYIYAQIIDDSNGKSMVAVSSFKRASKGKMTKKEAAKEVGKLIAKKASEKGIVKVSFDRGGYLYHGRVKALAEGAREAGLQF